MFESGRVQSRSFRAIDVGTDGATGSGVPRAQPPPDTSPHLQPLPLPQLEPAAAAQQGEGVTDPHVHGSVGTSAMPAQLPENGAVPDAPPLAAVPAVPADVALLAVPASEAAVAQQAVATSSAAIAALATPATDSQTTPARPHIYHAQSGTDASCNSAYQA